MRRPCDAPIPPKKTSVKNFLEGSIGLSAVFYNVLLNFYIPQIHSVSHIRGRVAIGWFTVGSWRVDGGAYLFSGIIFLSGVAGVRIAGGDGARFKNFSFLNSHFPPPQPVFLSSPCK